MKLGKQSLVKRGQTTFLHNRKRGLSPFFLSSWGPRRLPKHEVGQQECQAALGHAPEVLARLQDSRRLAGQEGVLAVVHDRVSLQQELEEYIHPEVDRRFALGQGIRAFQGMGEGDAGAQVLAAGEQLQRIARHAPVLVVVVAAAANYALVVTEAGAVFSEYR